MNNGAVVKSNPSDTMPPLLTWGMAAVIIGSVTALFGAYWDEGWHTDFGRDTFWIPPHIVLYAGIALVGVAVAMWTFLSCLQYKNLRATQKLLRHSSISSTTIYADVMEEEMRESVKGL